VGDADLLVLPGVGNFFAAARNMESQRERILELAEDGISILGICLGMQLLFPESDEGEGQGLSLFQGRNVRLPRYLKVPHMGWNTLDIVGESRILKGIENKSHFYFVHSYHPVPLSKKITVAETTYGVTFPSVVEKENICGTQFHPEKSGEQGMRMLRNLLEVVRR
jgi:glutamine amidotransferase